MRCVNPSKIDLIGQGKDMHVYVPCGACHQCRIMKKQAWVLRNRLEEKGNNHASFITLTYREEPENLEYNDIQRFHRRLRKNVGDEKIRFFIVGEYGEQSARPHWHALYYSDTDRYLRKVEAAWSQGFAYIGECNYKTIGYVCGYTLKNSIRPEIIVRSSLKPGIGHDKMVEYGKKLARVRPCLEKVPTRISLHGRSYPLDRYMYNTLEKAYLKGGGVINGRVSSTLGALRNLHFETVMGPEFAEYRIEMAKSSAQEQRVNVLKTEGISASGKAKKQKVV